MLNVKWTLVNISWCHLCATLFAYCPSYSLHNAALGLWDIFVPKWSTFLDNNIWCKLDKFVLQFRGGLELHITGTNLDTIQKPKMFFIYPSQNGTSVMSPVQVRTNNTWETQYTVLFSVSGIFITSISFVNVLSLCGTLIVRKKELQVGHISSFNWMAWWKREMNFFPSKVLEFLHVLFN